MISQRSIMKTEGDAHCDGGVVGKSLWKEMLVERDDGVGGKSLSNHCRTLECS